MDIYQLTFLLAIAYILFLIYHYKKKKSSSFEKFKNRKRYSYFTKEILEKIEDENLMQAIIDYIYDKIITDPVRDDKRPKNMSTGFKIVYAMWELEAEVNNGGFNQFFFNTNLKYEVYDACLAIGANKTAKIVKEAIEIQLEQYNIERPNGNDFDSYQITEYSEKSQNRLADLDLEFYKYQEDLETLVLTYIKNNYDEFVI
jgi:hypothetical protein